MKLRRVFALVPDCHVMGWRYGDVWRKHFYEGLEQCGLTVIRPKSIDFGWARPPQAFDAARSGAARTQASELLLNQILHAAGGPPGAVLSCCFSHDVELDLVERVRAAGIPWVNFFCDSLYAFDWVGSLAAKTSLNWFVESAAEERYRSLGVPVLCAPYALNPKYLPDASCASPSRALLFVGSANHFRLRVASLLRLRGADLHLRGWGWPEAMESRAPRSLFKRVAYAAIRRLLDNHVGGYVSDDAMLEELRRSAVVLGLNEGGTESQGVTYLKLRDLEFPGMGCCYLAQHHPDLGKVFDLGSEIMTFHTVRDADRIAKEFARHASTCRDLGQRARKRVLGEHTWAARLPMIESRL